MVYKHAYLNILLLLHSAFMLCLVKMPLKGEVGGCALNIHGIYIVDHGKSWNCVFEFLWEPCLKVLYVYTNHADPDEMLHNAAFHQGIHCLPKYSLGSLQDTKG